MPTSFWRVGLVCLGLAGLGATSLRWLVDRAGGGRRLRWILLSSFGLRALLAIALFVISDQRWPILRSLQSARGFWVFGLDGPLYHDFGARIVEAWTHGLSLPNPVIGFEYFAFVAAVYRILGCHPLYPILLNVWLAAVTGLLAFLLARRLFHHRAALTAAVLVGFWPSSLIWSSQLLKDALSWCVLFAALYLLLRLALPLPQGSGADRASRLGVGRAIGSVGRALGLWLALAAAVILCSRLRFYVGTIFAVAVFAVFLPAAAAAVLRRAPGRGLRYAGLLATVVLCTLFARTLNTYRLASPPMPDRGDVRLAVEHWRRGGLAEAANAFEAAMSLDPTYEEIYLSLGAVYLQQGDLANAARIYAAHLEHADFARHAEVQALLGTIRKAGPSAGLRMRNLVGNATALSALASGDIPKQDSRLQLLTQYAAGLDDQVWRSAADATPTWLDLRRSSYVVAGGYSVVDARVKISTLGQLARYLPRALAIGWLAPFPWQWFDAHGSTGGMRIVGGCEMALVYLLLLLSLVGVRELVQRRSLIGLVTLLFIALMSAGLSLVVANLGILFRLRLLFLLPLVVVAAGGDPLLRCRWAWSRVAGRMAHPAQPQRTVSAPVPAGHRSFDSHHGLWPWARSGFRPTGGRRGTTGSARGAP